MYLEGFRTEGINARVETLPRSSWQRKTLFSAASAFHGVFLHKKKLNPWDRFWLRHYSRKIIYDFDDAVMFDEQHPNRWSIFRRLDFARTVRLSDTVLAGNEYLAEQARQCHRNVHVLPTGLDVKEYPPGKEFHGDGKIRLVWIGSRATLDYLRSIQSPLEEIGRLYPNVILRVISDVFPEFSQMPMERVPWAQERQGEDLAACDIGLAPLTDNRYSRGKCGFKILQYMAARLPSIASPVGVNTELVRTGVSGFLASKDPEWVDALKRLIENPSLRREMGQSARKRVEREFDSSVIGSRLLHILRSAL